RRRAGRRGAGYGCQSVVRQFLPGRTLCRRVRVPDVAGLWRGVYRHVLHGDQLPVLSPQDRAPGRPDAGAGRVQRAQFHTVHPAQRRRGCGAGSLPVQLPAVYLYLGHGGTRGALALVLVLAARPCGQWETLMEAPLSLQRVMAFEAENDPGEPVLPEWRVPRWSVVRP